MQACQRGRRSVGEGRISAMRFGHPALGLLPFLRPAERREVKYRVGVPYLIGAAGEGGVGVEYLVAITQEAAQRPDLRRFGNGFIAVLRRGSEIVDLGGDGFIEGRVEVIVEVASIGGA